MVSIKDKRKSGWVEPRSTIYAKKKDIIDDCLEPEPYWDDWIDHRDGFRGYDDKSKIRSNDLLRESFEIPRWNKKNKKLLNRRNARKWSMKGIKQY